MLEYDIFSYFISFSSVNIISGGTNMIFNDDVMMMIVVASVGGSVNIISGGTNS